MSVWARQLFDASGTCTGKLPSAIPNRSQEDADLARAIAESQREVGPGTDLELEAAIRLSLEEANHPQGQPDFDDEELARAIALSQSDY
jgi:hypothetical protein